MRIVGIDLGERHVGLATWDDPDLPARPLDTVDVTAATVVDRIVARVKIEQADELVVGLPIRLDGREGLAARHARRIAKDLAKRTGLPVHLQDERLTTAQAHVHRKMAGQKGRAGIDAHAAAILLQTFVDTRNGPWRADEPDE